MSDIQTHEIAMLSDKFDQIVMNKIKDVVIEGGNDVKIHDRVIFIEMSPDLKAETGKRVQAYITAIVNKKVGKKGKEVPVCSISDWF